MSLQNLLEKISPLDRTGAETIQAHLDDLVHPKGSLGRLEELAMQICLIQGTCALTMGKMKIVTFAADHGVAEEGVSTAPKVVTQQMVHNFLAGGAGVNVFCSHGGIEHQLVDMGVDAEFGDLPGLIDCKVRMGTHNLRVGPAMSEGEAEQAILSGAAIAAEAAASGVELLGTGEMGIANTTPSAALFAAYLGLNPDITTGRGTGIDDATLAHKKQVINDALSVNAARLDTPLGVLAAVGGFEIAGITGLCLGAAAAKVPVVVDGFISSAGALAACRLCPPVQDYLIFSHYSADAGYKAFVEGFGIRPLLDLDMRLGEGTGAALAMNIVSASVAMVTKMATFSGAQVSALA